MNDGRFQLQGDREGGAADPRDAASDPCAGGHEPGAETPALDARFREALSRAMGGPAAPQTLRASVRRASSPGRRRARWMSLAASLMLIGFGVAETRRWLDPHHVFVPGARINNGALVDLFSDLARTHEDWSNSREANPAPAVAGPAETRAAADWLQVASLPLPADPAVSLHAVHTTYQPDARRAAVLHFIVTHPGTAAPVEHASVVYMREHVGPNLRDGVTFRVPHAAMCFNVCQRGGLTICTLSNSHRACERVGDALGLPKSSAVLVLGSR